MLNDPTPRLSPIFYKPFAWPNGVAHKLLPGRVSCNVDLVSTLEQRETRREFSLPISNDRFGEFLWFACRNRSSRPSQYGFDQESRVYPSAGAMHPIHVLIARPGEGWMRYDPVAHMLIEVAESTTNATSARLAIEPLVPLGLGVLIALVAEPGKTAAKYVHHKTLIWRDAGVVLGYMSLIAEMLGLSFCPLGVTGNSFLLDGPLRAAPLQGVGLAVIGVGKP